MIHILYIKLRLPVLAIAFFIPWSVNPISNRGATIGGGGGDGDLVLTGGWGGFLCCGGGGVGDVLNDGACGGTGIISAALDDLWCCLSNLALTILECLVLEGFLQST